jgi:hypothetical protein
MNPFPSPTISKVDHQETPSPSQAANENHLHTGTLRMRFSIDGGAERACLDAISDSFSSIRETRRTWPGREPEVKEEIGRVD